MRQGRETGAPSVFLLSAGPAARTRNDVLYVGGPADRLSILEQQSETLFRLEPDGQHVVGTRVVFGRIGRSTGETRFDKVIEIRSGLQPGDEVVLSDMSAFKGKDRVRLQ